MTDRPSPAEALLLDPIEGILAVLDRGQATGTNKFSLLLAIMELAPVAGPDRRIPLTAIAAKILELHWDQVAPFPAPELGGDLVLSQVTSGNRESTAVSEVLRLRALLPAHLRNRGLDRVRHAIAAQEWERSVGRVRSAALRNPVRFLQRIDGAVIPFLFTLDAGSDSLELTPHAAGDLIRYGPVLKELVQSRFVRVVLDANAALQRTNLESRVEEHLFGSDRQMPGSSLRQELAALQGNVCLYTGRPLAHRGAPIDHVVPWSRVRLSGLGNFVVTTRSVNSSKSDLLLAPEPLARWIDHVGSNAEGLAGLAARHDWPADPEGTIEVALRLYRSLRPGVVLWAPHGVRIATERDLAAAQQVLLGAA